MKSKFYKCVYIAEPILEAVPQVYIMLILWGFLGPLTGSIRRIVILGLVDQRAAFYLATFTSSVLSASKGIAGFLLHGPCKLVPTDGLFGGMGKLGFILLVLNIALTLCGKGVVLGAIFVGSYGSGLEAVSSLFHSIFKNISTDFSFF